MAYEQQQRFLIAAGGTVGHVAPALAVAEALRRRGGLVTFAGSPDRVEARLVPEQGYEFDAFSVSGLPRRPGAEARTFSRCQPATAPSISTNRYGAVTRLGTSVDDGPRMAGSGAFHPLIRVSSMVALPSDRWCIAAAAAQALTMSAHPLLRR